MKIDPIAFELEVVVVPAFDHAPGFVVGDIAHPLQDLVGDARSAIGGALVLVERCERGDAFRTIEDHGMSSRGRMTRPCCNELAPSMAIK